MDLYLEYAPGQQLLVWSGVEHADLSGGKKNTRGRMLSAIRAHVAAAKHILSERGVCLSCGAKHCGPSLFEDDDGLCCGECSHLRDERPLQQLA